MEATKHRYALAREEGETLWFLGVPTRVIATAEQTGGAFGLIEHVIPAGGESPWHVHHADIVLLVQSFPSIHRPS
jgi:quercetin dioxygenase-like cupin family protein